MKVTIPFIICIVGFVLGPTSSQDPTTKCINDGDPVCVNCITIGICRGTPGSFTITEETPCPLEDGTFCDNNVNVGECFRYSSGVSACVCGPDDVCIADPNNEKFYINCDDNFNPFECDSENFIASSCTCSTETDASPATSSDKSTLTTTTPNESTTTATATTTPNESTTTAAATTTPNESTTTTIATTTQPEIICPEDCPFANDPTSCEGYYQCTTGDPIPFSCPDTFCFIQEACQCLPGGTTTPVTCPDDCPFVDDPKDDCSSYFACVSGGDPIQYTCPSPRCFDQESCGCIETSSKTPTTSTTSSVTTTTSTATTTTTSRPSTALTCPPECPFVEIPDENCQNFYICSNGELVPSQCPGNLCFDQNQCECVL